MKYSLSLLICFLGFSTGAISQPSAHSDNAPNAKIAFLKSMVLPGWGHYYVNHSDWNRGKYHMAADAVLILSYLGFAIHSNSIQQNWYSYSRSGAGVPIKGRSRRFQIAVGNFDNLQAYNDYQARSRNWDLLFDDTLQNQWSWDSEAARLKYNDLRDRFERIDNQLPGFLVLMVVNRVISGISAYNRARKYNQSQSVTSDLYLSPYYAMQGFVANLRLRF
ncbi:MAG TPA: hypothetical protein VJ964_12360 [Balneolaceae bacterium]|nr:hypothetical protein [Balneolaceae bacterium]